MSNIALRDFNARLYGKNVSRVMISCPSQGIEILACACSVWRDLARLDELTGLKPFTWEKVAPPPYLATPPQDRFTVSHVSGRRWFISSCRKTWLAPLTQGVGDFFPYKQELSNRSSQQRFRFQLVHQPVCLALGLLHFFFCYMYCFCKQK